METKSQSISLKVILIIMAVGIWTFVLQNAGIIPTKQNVYVKGGYVNADINGTLDVNVENEVDVNVSSVNEHSNAFYGPSSNGNYDAIHVYTGN